MSGKDPWFDEISIENITGIVNLVNQFSEFFYGVVLYDPNVSQLHKVVSYDICRLPQPVTSRQLPLLPRIYFQFVIVHLQVIFGHLFTYPVASLYSLLVENGPMLPIKRNLVGVVNGNITGSTKCDSYLYAIKEFIFSGKSDPRFMTYYVDYFWTKCVDFLRF